MRPRGSPSSWMHSSVTTTVQEVVGLYEGQRIARTSNAVVNVIISRRYVYEGCEIYVDNIEAQQDQETGRMYVPGPQDHGLRPASPALQNEPGIPPTWAIFNSASASSVTTGRNASSTPQRNGGAAG